MKRQGQFGVLAQALAIVMLVVLAVTGTVQAAHVHPADSGHDGHCQLCLMAHHSVVPELQTAPVCTRAIVAAVLIPDAQPLSSLAVFATRMRPPPIAL